MKYRVLDLFSGIGGFSLGLERTGGFETAAFCEIEEYPRKVLAKHWPDVPCYGDIRELTADILERDGIAVDVICGGFPCQDVSFAGKRAGLEGARSGLWSEYARLIGELRPRFVIVENVPGLLNLGMGAVLGDLAALGYGATWDCIPASAVGAPHRRDRVWLVAYSESERRGKAWKDCKRSAQRPSSGCDVSNASSQRLSVNQGRGKRAKRDRIRTINGCCWPYGADDNWSVEPNVGRVAYGIPKRVDRLKALGNAVVPQIPELIGRAILAAEAPK